MRVSLLTANTSARERCPYCHDSLGEVERVACEGCGTPHHPVCLEELGGCTVLGCAGGAVAAPVGPVEEIRRRVRARAERYTKVHRIAAEPEEAVRQRLAEQPGFCVACERELLVASCPMCTDPIVHQCGGDSVHCARESCRPFYAKLAQAVGQPLDVPDFKGQLAKPLAGFIALAVGTVLLLSLVLTVLLGGSEVAGVVALPLVLLGAGTFVFGPLLVMMVTTRRT
jgi:hypothetical protein